MRDQLDSFSHHWRDGATSTWVSPSEESGKTANRCFFFQKSPRWSDINSRKKIVFGSRSFQFSIFVNFFNFEKKTSVARLLGPYPFTLGKPSAGHFRPAGQYFGHPWFKWKEDHQHRMVHCMLRLFILNPIHGHDIWNICFMISIRNHKCYNKSYSNLIIRKMYSILLNTKADEVAMLSMIVS